MTGLLLRQSSAPARVLGAAALFAAVWFFNSESFSKFTPLTASTEGAATSSLQTSSSPFSEERKVLAAVAPRIADLPLH